MTQTREAWLEERRKGIGGSEAAIVLGVSPYSSKLDLYAEKRGLVEPSEMEEWQRVGLLLEPVILAEYNRIHGTAFEMWPQWQQAVHPDHPWMRCTPDVLPVDKRGVSLKTASLRVHDQWVDGPPVHYQVQCQHEMAVLGLESMDIIVFKMGFGPAFEVHHIPRNQEFIEKMVALEEQFWRDVQAGAAPAPEDPEDHARFLARFFPRSEPVTVVLPPDCIAAVDRLTGLDEEDKRVASEIEAEKNRLKEAMGTAEVGIIGSRKISWKSNKKGTRVFLWKEKA